MTHTIQIAERSYKIAPLTAEQNRRLWVTPDLTLTVWEQWEGTIQTSFKNAGNPIDKQDLAKLPYEQMQQIILEISKITLEAAQAATESSTQPIH
jgi:hypothetical protein